MGNPSALAKAARRGGLSGVLVAGRVARADAGSDFGGLVRRNPAAIVRAKDIKHVVNAVRFANDAKVEVAARGQGHTTRGQSLVADGLVIDTRGLAGLRMHEGMVVAGAGALWSSLLEHTLSVGLTPPVLTDYLGLSVGGTLSIGGIGGQSFRYGMQTDHIHELTVVTGTGDVVVCSPHEETDLFDACRAGLGQCGIIVEAKLGLIRAPNEVRLYELPYPDLRSFLDDQIVLVERREFDFLRGVIVPDQEREWRFAIEAVQYLDSKRRVDEATLLRDLGFVPRSAQAMTLSYPTFAHRLDALVRQMKRAGTWEAYHPWIDLFMPPAAAHDFIETALREIEPGALAGGYAMTYPFARSVCSTPLLDLPGDTHTIGFDLLPSFAIGEDGRVDHFEACCQKMLERARAIGARIYPIGYPVGTSMMRESDWRWQFAREWERFAAAKTKYDPLGVLTPSPRIFARRE